MIKNTFLFLDRFSRKKEQQLWDKGIKTWDDFLKADSIKGISKKAKLYYDKQITELKNRYDNEDILFFSKLLPEKEKWRLYDDIKDNAVFLDIETCYRNKEITVIGFYDGYETNTLVNNATLSKENINSIISRHSAIITFNGASFDIPLIEKRFGMKIEKPHIDMMHVCRLVDLKGGLKDIETQLGILRPAHLKPNSCNPVELWKAFHASGDEEYLQLLVDYNREDVENLKSVADIAVRRINAQLNI